MTEERRSDVPQRIGKYDVLGELGHGGMAVVYRARDSRLLREVAVKVLHPHLAREEESKRRFLREARAAAKLKHPYIVEVYDFSDEHDRESFMVSELLDGPTLRRFAEEHTEMPAEIVACIGIVLCDALACAHAQGVVHRDVKPDNILLHGKGLLKLTDFGIAHVSDGNGMTVTGQLLGSPAHMAPEQVDGGDVDGRTDLFALGTVLYVLATGRLPFEGTTPHALLRKILESDYPDPVRVAPKAGEQFAKILRRCLQREPDRRFASAAELRSALCAFLNETELHKPEEFLRQYFDNAELVEKEHLERLRTILPRLGIEARDKGNIPGALAYFNRGLALFPGDASLLTLVRSIAQRARRKRMLRSASIVVAAACCSAIVIGVSARMLRAAPVPRLRSLEASDAGLSLVLWARAPMPPALSVVQTAPETPSTPRAGVPVEPAVAPSPAARPTARVGVRPPVAGPPVRVRLVFNPPGVYYSIDRAPLAPFDTENPYVELRPGPHTFRLVPSNGACDEIVWFAEVGPTTNRIERRFVCRPRHLGGDAQAALPR